MQPQSPLDGGFPATPTDLSLQGAEPSTSTAPAKKETITIPTNRVDSERLALHLVSSATTARHNAAATLAPYLDPQGGVKDIPSAVNMSTFAQLTAALGEPTFTAQLQLCDALLATTHPAAFTYLGNNANLAAALQTMMARALKGKQITLVVRALHAMVHLGGFTKEYLSYKTLQLLRFHCSASGGEAAPPSLGSPAAAAGGNGGGASHPAVREAAKKLLALYPDEQMKVFEEDLKKVELVNQQQQQWVPVEVEEAAQDDGKEQEKVPDNEEPSAAGFGFRQGEQDLAAARGSSEIKEANIEQQQLPPPSSAAVAPLAVAAGEAATSAPSF
jgi:hypothetical protein